MLTANVMLSLELREMAGSKRAPKKLAEIVDEDLATLPPDIAAEIMESRRQGSVSYSTWPSYSWKNEIDLQLKRVKKHYAEWLDESYEGEHSPFDMIERALGVMAFCMRRLIERRLITDELASLKFPVRAFPAAAGFEPLMLAQSGGRFFRNYEVKNHRLEQLSIKAITDEIIHSSQLLMLSGGKYAPDGLIIVSDWRQKKRALHFTIPELEAHVMRVLDDRVAMFSDGVDPVSGEVSVQRLSTGQLRSRTSERP